MVPASRGTLVITTRLSTRSVSLIRPLYDADEIESTVTSEWLLERNPRTKPAQPWPLAMQFNLPWPKATYWNHHIRIQERWKGEEQDRAPLPHRDQPGGRRNGHEGHHASPSEVAADPLEFAGQQPFWRGRSSSNERRHFELGRYKLRYSK